MAKKKNKAKKLDTFIGESSSIKGDITSKNSISIEGMIEGNINAVGEVIIGKQAKIYGDITGSSVSVSGKIEGNIKANDYVKLFSTSLVLGDIYSKNFIADEGAVFNGKCVMSPDQKNIQNK